MAASGRSLASVMAMQPEPVPTSRMIGCSGRTRGVDLTPGKYGLPASFKTESMSCSVSGRGTKTSGVTMKSRP